MTTIIQFYAVYMGPVQEHKAMRYLFRRYMPRIPADPPFSLGRDNEPKLWFAPEHPDLGYVTDDQLVFDQIPPLIPKTPVKMPNIPTSTGHNLTVLTESPICLITVTKGLPGHHDGVHTDIVLTDDQRLKLIKALEGI